MTQFTIRIDLMSDATFGRGEGLAGVVDQEVEHDRYGLPFLRGRALKGLLVEECANILYALGTAPDELKQAAAFLFGQAGSTLNDDAKMPVGAAQLPGDLRRAIEADVESGNDVEAGKLTRLDVLESLTAIRRQTAVTETGAPEDGSLRSMRVILRGTSFVAPLHFDAKPDDKALSLLAACVMALRRAGTGRNRGRGRLSARLYEDGSDVTDAYFAAFRDLVNQSQEVQDS